MSVAYNGFACSYIAPLAISGAFTAATMLLAMASPASAAVQITELTKIAIETGNLVIIGKTRHAGRTVKLDNGVATTVSDANRNFSFELVYLPPGCVVELKVGTEIKTAVVANCGPKGVNPKGAWRSTTSYLTDDLVTFRGSSWRAMNDNRRKRPDGNPSIWEQFAARGLRGQKGETGPQGIKGVKGDTGDQGLQGIQGVKGDQGTQGVQGPTGPAGADGASCSVAQCSIANTTTFTCEKSRKAPSALADKAGPHIRKKT